MLKLLLPEKKNIFFWVWGCMDNVLFIQEHGREVDICIVIQQGALGPWMINPNCYIFKYALCFFPKKVFLAECDFLLKSSTAAANC